MIIHAGFLRKHLKLTNIRLAEVATETGTILQQWMTVTQKENFLYTHFTEICEILKQYDVTILLGSALRSHSIYDANDSAQFAELRVLGELTQKAREQFVQVIVEGPGHTPLNKIQENIKEQQYLCKQTPFFTTGSVSTDITPGNEYIASAIGAAHIAWLGASLISDQYSGKDTEMIKNRLIAHKIAAHSADLAKGHPGAQIRDNALSKARFEGRKRDVINLSLDPAKTAKFLQ